MLSYFFGEDIDSGTVPAQGPTARRAYDLTLLAVSCWYAAAWDGYENLGWITDTLGNGRCTELAQRVYGQDRSREPSVIDASPAAVANIASTVERLALGEPRMATHASELATLVRAVGAARREELIARLIGSAQMLTKTSQHLQLGDIPQNMQNHPALETLLHLDAGEFSADARTLGLLAALNLTLVPKGNHGYSDIYQMALLRNVLGTVFGPFPAASPMASESTTQADAAWLAYRVKVAGQAGHTPSAVGTFDRRSAVAWRGILLGFADKLHAQSKQLSPDGRTTLLPLIQRMQARLKWANIDELEVP